MAFKESYVCNKNAYKESYIYIMYHIPCILLIKFFLAKLNSFSITSNIISLYALAKDKM